MRSVAALSALSAAALAAPAPAPEAAPVVVPLAARSNGLKLTRDDGSANIAAILASFNRTAAKYHKAPLPYYPAIAQQQQDQGLIGLLGLKKRQAAKEPLADQVETGGIDELYYGPTTVGSGDGKPQTFTVDFDTGSSDIFIPGPACGTSQGCPHSTKYDQGGADLHKTTSVTYGSGQISGEDYSDDLSVAGLQVTKQTLISLTQAAGFDTSNADGLLGMGFSSIAQTGAPTYFENLIAQGKVSTQEFAFYLGRAKSNTQGASSIAFGGRDSSKFTGTPTQIAVTTPGYWQVALDNVKVNGKSAGPLTAGQAAIDTGTTLVVAPTVAGLSIHAQIPGAIPVPLGQQTLFLYPCKTSAKYVPSITFGGKDFAINPLDFNLGTVTSFFGLDLGNSTLANIITQAVNTYCVSGIASLDIDPTQNLYIVGDGFLKNWYSIYNYNNNGGKPSVSFAKAVGNQ